MATAVHQETRVLIIDGDNAFSRYLVSHLSRRNFDVSVAESGEEALRIFRTVNPTLVLMDLALPSLTGADTLQRLRQIRPDLPVIIVSGQNNPEMIFRASRAGAEDFLSKPLDMKELDARMSRILERLPSVAASSNGVRDGVRSETMRGENEFSMLFGASPKMEDVKMTIEKVADTNATVLIRGESGTGKEMVARMVYANSGRREKPFVKVNCAAIPH